MFKLRFSLLLLLPIVLLIGEKAAIAQNTSPLFRETFRGNILENLGSVNYRITTSRDSSRPANDPLSSQSVCLTASQDVTNTVGLNQTNASNIPGCAPGLEGLPTSGDSIGAGALRLTSNRIAYIADGRTLAGQGERGSFIIDQAFPREDGLIVEFDFFIYNGKGNGTEPSADGLSFFLMDGSTINPVPGAFGGSLGYAQATQGGVQNGASNGFLGIGFDVYGNFSDPGEGRNGGPGRQTDRIVLRGSESKQYPFITNVTSSSLIGTGIDDEASITTPKIRNQGNIQGRRARITITPEGFLSVGISTQTGENVADTAFVNVFNQTIDLKQGTPIAGGIDALAPIPNTFKFGFAASTGFSTAIHELRNLIIRPVRQPPVAQPGNLRLVKRVTAVTRNGIRTEFNQFTDDPNSPIDNLPGWSQPNATPVGVINVPANLSVQSNDEIEYSVYYLADGGTTIADVNICDAIPTNTTYIPNSSQISRSGNPVIAFGTFFSPLQPIPNPTACSSTNSSNNNGSLFYSLGNLSVQNGQNFGFVRFKARVNGA